MIRFIETPTRIRLIGPSKPVNRIANELKFRPDNYWRADSYILYKRTAHLEKPLGWDGYTYPLQVKERMGERLLAEAGRGFLDRLLELCKLHEFEVDGTKLLPRPFRDLQPDDLPDDLIVAPFELDEDQRQAVCDWLVHNFGVHQFTVGGGKTALFCASASMVKRRYPDARFLYLTPTERLVNQVTKEARKFLPDFAISQYGGGKKDPNGEDMVVATGAMLNTNFDTLRINGWFKKFMGILVDESHHASSPSWEAILKATPAIFRFGASDSTRECDESKFTKIQGLLGPIRHVVGAAPLIQSGRLAQPHIYLVDRSDWTAKFVSLKHEAEEDSTVWALIDDVWTKGTYLGPAVELDEEGEPKLNRKKEPIRIPNLQRVLIDGEEREVGSRWCLLDRVYDRAITRFSERNNVIVDWVEWYSKQGFPTLVVCTRTLHILILRALIEKRGIKEVDILYSEHSTRERDETFEWFKTTPGSVLISPLCKEGVSINEIRAGVVADYVGSAEYANQIIGRFLRKKEGTNEAHITWFLERQHPSLRKGSMKLFQQLKEIRGYNFYHPCNMPEAISTAQKYTSLRA